MAVHDLEAYAHKIVASYEALPSGAAKQDFVGILFGMLIGLEREDLIELAFEVIHKEYPS